MAKDWTKIGALLSVIHSASAAGPKFQKYAQAANDELEADWAEDQPEKEPEPEEVEEVDEPELKPTNGRRV
jgi:hypothetical protein